MSTQIKLIIPLLDPNITKDDISPEAGFYNAYIYDINKPSLVDNIFLVYKLGVNDKKARAREERFKESKYIKSTRYAKIDGEWYIVYVFVILNKDINFIKQALPTSSVKNTFRILSFWKGSDNAVNNAVLYPSEPYSIQTEHLPEEDYTPSAIDCYALKYGIENPEVS